MLHVFRGQCEVRGQIILRWVLRLHSWTEWRPPLSSEPSDLSIPSWEDPFPLDALRFLLFPESTQVNWKTHQRLPANVRPGDCDYCKITHTHSHTHTVCLVSFVGGNWDPFFCSLENVFRQRRRKAEEGIRRIVVRRRRHTTATRATRWRDLPQHWPKIRSVHYSIKNGVCVCFWFLIPCDGAKSRPAIFCSWHKTRFQKSFLCSMASKTPLPGNQENIGYKMWNCECINVLELYQNRLLINRIVELLVCHNLLRRR